VRGRSRGSQNTLKKNMADNGLIGTSFSRKHSTTLSHARPGLSIEKLLRRVREPRGRFLLGTEKGRGLKEKTRFRRTKKKHR